MANHTKTSSSAPVAHAPVVQTVKIESNIIQANETLLQQQEEIEEEKVMPKSLPTGGQIDLGGEETEESLIQTT